MGTHSGPPWFRFTVMKPGLPPAPASLSSEHRTALHLFLQQQPALSLILCEYFQLPCLSVCAFSLLLFIIYYSHFPFSLMCCTCLDFMYICHTAVLGTLYCATVCCGLYIDDMTIKTLDLTNTL